MNRYDADEATVWTWYEADRIAIKWRSQARWDDIRVSLKEHFPRHADLSYSGTRKLWSVPAWQRERLEDWLCWTFEPEAVHWDEEPAGPCGRTYSQSRRYSGTRQSRASTTSSVDAAYAALHLLPTAPAWAAEAVYRAAIKVHHPDAGGDAQTMVRVNVAMQTIREHQQEERKAS